jgi:uncharacterized membrane protein
MIAQAYIRRAERHIRCAYALFIVGAVVGLWAWWDGRWVLALLNVGLMAAQIYLVRLNLKIIAIWRATQ